VAFPKSHAEPLHRLGRILVKSMLSVLSCLDTRKKQRKSRLKSPTRWVPRGRNCHAAQLAPHAAWLKQCRLGIPALRSAPDPFSGHAFMPFLLISATFNVSRLSGHRGEYLFPAGAEEKGKGQYKDKG